DFERLIALVDALHKTPAGFSGAEAMAEASGIGITKLHALFRQHYHTTPAAYLNRVKVAAACRLLSDPERKIIDAAYGAGYVSLSTFYENFRKAMGLSPKEYQSLVQGDSFTLTLPKNYLSCITCKMLGRDPDSVVAKVDGDYSVKALNVCGRAVLLHMQW